MPRVTCPTACLTCLWRREDWRDGGWCYYFTETPAGCWRWAQLMPRTPANGGPGTAETPQGAKGGPDTPSGGPDAGNRGS